MKPDGRREDRFLYQLDWNLLKCFSIVAETGGVTRAAQKLRRKQPAVSLALKRLEERLNARLCERGPSGFKLTEEGERLIETCVQLNALIRLLPEHLADAKQTVRSPIRIGLISNLVDQRLDAVITRFHDKFPSAKLLVDVASWSDVVNSLLLQEIDIGIAPAPNRRAELNYHTLFSEVHRPHCGRRHRLYGKFVSDPRDLSDEAFVLTGADEPLELSNFRLKYNIGRNVAGVSEHLEEARRLAALGVGICFLPEAYAAPDVAAGNLWPLLVKRRSPKMEVYVITNPNAPAHRLRRLFLDELQGIVRKKGNPDSPHADRTGPLLNVDE